ncbi:hypothetical protein NQ317_006641 [Molorchus minor]|uniref:Uncharacterized protein n=1 Tax=Molorchus minor TaxID=1323400 RepID=A0ABQ9IWV0_9CUCU|nr:hypothetical protein NQ317_006641 [Molorchus minor]
MTNRTVGHPTRPRRGTGVHRRLPVLFADRQRIPARTVREPTTITVARGMTQMGSRATTAVIMGMLQICVLNLRSLGLRAETTQWRHPDSPIGNSCASSVTKLDTKLLNVQDTGCKIAHCWLNVFHHELNLLHQP